MQTTLDLEKKNRLIVILPGSLAGNTQLAYKVYWMALRDRYDVFYLTLVEDADESLSVSRRIATMKAVTGNGGVIAGARLVDESSWFTVLQGLYRRGDALVCFEEQYVKKDILTHVPVQEYLQEQFKAPIHTLHGFYNPWQEQTRRWIRSFIFWAGSLSILAGFAFLEFQVDRNVQGVARSVILIFTLSIEFGTLLTWNRITKR